MREIKFRGKIKSCSSNNGEWIYGFPINRMGGSEAIQILEIGGYYENGFGVYGHYEHIDTKTIGQYIELKDKNGKEIYEGDIVKIHRNWSEDGICCMNEEIGQVEYSDGAFNFARIEEKPRLIRPFMEICEFIGLKHLEVIGNIYENPELLEVE